MDVGHGEIGALKEFSDSAHLIWTLTISHHVYAAFASNGQGFFVTILNNKLVIPLLHRVVVAIVRMSVSGSCVIHLEAAVRTCMSRRVVRAFL